MTVASGAIPVVTMSPGLAVQFDCRLLEAHATRELASFPVVALKGVMSW
jgi:hypothetical protein